MLQLPDSEAAKKRRRILFMAGSVLLPFVWMLFLRVISFGNGENSLDCFYHFRISELGPSVFLSGEFPALQLSVWKDSFADKELLFHVFLWIVTGIRKLFCEIPSLPFHFEYFPFLLALLAAFVFAARRMDVRARIIFAGALLLPMLTANELARIEMLRPHLLSLIFMFLAFGILSQGSLKSRVTGIGILSFFYAMGYSNPHFIVLPALFFALTGFGKDRFAGFLQPLIAFLLVFAGLLLHPHPSNIFLIWKVQSLDAIASPLNAFLDPNRIPNELTSPNGRDFVTAIPLYLVTFFNLAMLIRICEYRGFKAIPSSAAAVAITGFFYTVIFFWMKRSIEYAAPFSVLAFLALLDYCLREDLLLTGMKQHWKRFSLGIFCVSVAVAGISSYLFYNRTHNHVFTAKPELSRYIRENFSEGYALFNADWSDFPQLYYELPQYHWQWGLDPSFSYAADERKAKILTATVPAYQFRQITGLQYAVLLSPREARKNHLLSCGWRLIAEFPGEGWVFTNIPETQEK